MSFFKKLFCKHEWRHRGWSYVKCTKCNKVEDNPELNERLQRDIWERMVDENNPPFTREAINKLLRPRGRQI